MASEASGAERSRGSAGTARAARHGTGTNAGAGTNAGGGRRSASGARHSGKAAAAETAASGGSPGEGPGAPGKRRIVFVDIGRALGALFVVYSHFDWLFLRENKGEVTWFSRVFEDVIVAPLRLTEQGIGAVAVPFFFLASGFVVTPIVLRLGAGRFSVNRAFRVYPLLIFVVAVSATAFAFGLRPLTTGRFDEVTVGSVLSNISLVNFFDKPMVAFVGVAWTLAVEVLFYLLITALLPVLRRLVWLAIAIELEIVVLVLSTHAQFGENYRAVAVNVAYLAMPILGQVLWAAHQRKIPVWLASCYLVVGWGLFVWAGNLAIDPDYQPRPYPFAVAIVLFLLGMFAERHLRERRVWAELSERTYSIYLLHGAVGFPLMFLVYDSVPVWLTLLTGVAGTAVAVEISYRLVERPSHNLGRRLSRRRTGAASVADTDRDNRAEREPEPSPSTEERPAGCAEPGPESGVERTDVLPLVALRGARPAPEADLRSVSGQLGEQSTPPTKHGNGRAPGNGQPPGNGRPHGVSQQHGNRPAHGDGQPHGNGQQPGTRRPRGNGQPPTPYARPGNGRPKHARADPTANPDHDTNRSIQGRLDEPR